MALSSTSPVPLNLPQSLLQAKWASLPYQQPQVFYHSVIAPYASEVSKWRPFVATTRLVDVMNLFIDLKRLAGIQDAAIQQASQEILHIAKSFCEKWNSFPGLRIQLNCTATKQNLHVRQFWIIAIAAMVLSDDRICYYEADEEGVTVHDARGIIRYSAWAKIPSFYRQLQCLPPLQPPEKQQCSRDTAPAVDPTEREPHFVTGKLDKPQPRDVQSENDFTGDLKTDADGASCAVMLDDLHVPPELQYRPNEHVLQTMLANGLA